MPTLFQAIAAPLNEPDPTAKCALVAAIAEDLAAGTIAITPSDAPCVVERPAIPARPQLVAARDLPKRKLGTAEGHAALIHAVCHIEFSAINLALDAAARFPGQPVAYYKEWVDVAKEEAEHFQMIAGHLATLGKHYGDFEAHNGLWDTAARSKHDCLRRMALVPRVMEARGLDVTPDMVKKLRQIGDEAGAQILEKILADEVGHVAVGSRWFKHLCAERSLSPEPTFAQLVNDELGGLRGGACNREARLRAGFSAAEIDALFPQ